MTGINSKIYLTLLLYSSSSDTITLGRAGCDSLGGQAEQKPYSDCLLAAQCPTVGVTLVEHSVRWLLCKAAHTANPPGYPWAPEGAVLLPPMLMADTQHLQ